MIYIMLKFISKNCKINSNDNKVFNIIPKENNVYSTLTLKLSFKTFIQFKINLVDIDSIIIISDNYKKYINENNYLISGIYDKIEIIVLMEKKTSIFNINDIIIKQNLSLIKINYDNILIINLKKDLKRRSKITEQFKKINITKYEFIDAINGNDFKDDFKKIKKNSKIINTGHFGCLKSHIYCIELAKKRKYENILIMEDDIIINNSFVNEIIVPDNIDIIYLGGIIKEKKCFNTFAYSNNIIGCYAYILNIKIYDKILNILKSYVECIDIAFINSIQMNNNTIILNDIITTTIETSNTSNKTNCFFDKFNKINNNDNNIINLNNINIIDNNKNNNIILLFNIKKFKYIDKLEDDKITLIITFDNIDISHLNYIVFLNDLLLFNDCLLNKKFLYNAIKIYYTNDDIYNTYKELFNVFNFTKILI